VNEAAMAFMVMPDSGRCFGRIGASPGRARARKEVEASAEPHNAELEADP